MAEAKCENPYGFSVDLPAPWRTKWCAKENLFQKGTKHASNYAFEIVNDTAGFRFDLVAKDPSRDYSRVKYVTWEIERYSKSPSKVRYNYRALGGEDAEVKETKTIGGVTYEISYQTYSINEPRPNEVVHKRRVAFVWFKAGAYEGYGFMRYIGPQPQAKPGQTFNENEHPRQYVEQVLQGLSLAQ